MRPNVLGIAVAFTIYLWVELHSYAAIPAIGGMRPKKIVPPSSAEIKERFERLKNFSPGERYIFAIELFEDNLRLARGTMQGEVTFDRHLITIKLQPEEKNKPELRIEFEKNHPEKILFYTEGKEGTRLGYAEWLTPLFPQTGCCIFTICLPFLDWSKKVYLGSERKKGRPAHKILLIAPEEITKLNGIASVEAFLDASFDGFLEVSAFDKEKHRLSRVSVLDFKKFNAIWSFKSVELECNGKKTRLTLVDLISEAEKN